MGTNHLSLKGDRMVLWVTWAFWILLGSYEYITGGFVDQATCEIHRAWAVAAVKEQKGWGADKANRAVSPCAIH